MDFRHCYVLVAALVFLALPFRASADDSPQRHEFMLGLGVPVPISVHGESSGDSQSSIDFIGHSFAAYRWRPISQWSWLGVELQISASRMVGSVNDVPGTITWWSMSPHLAASGSPFQRYPDLVVEGGAGPSVLRNTTYVDQDINKRVHSIGVQLFTAIGWRVRRNLQISTRAGLDLYTEPYDDKTWYNHPLGQTRFATFDLVAQLRW